MLMYGKNSPFTVLFSHTTYMEKIVYSLLMVYSLFYFPIHEVILQCNNDGQNIFQAFTSKSSIPEKNFNLFHPEKSMGTKDNEMSMSERSFKKKLNLSKENGICQINSKV